MCRAYRRQGVHSHSSKTAVAETRPTTLASEFRLILTRVNEPHAFLGAGNAHATGRLCFVEPPIGA
jgi:hypothetical protein